ncbi:hypothetical protein DESC_40112 [Desulfosarcina cetonica]|nr:hypothetical protein DESC_40112 [Desulfosarcina cetonica]
MPVGAVPVPENDLQGRIEPAGGDHFINGFLGDAVVFHSRHIDLNKKSPHDPLTDHEGD